MMAEKVFQLHVATPTYATHPNMSLYKTREETSSIESQSKGSSFSVGVQQARIPCWCATGSSFPACEQNGVLSLPVLHRVFFPSCCFTNFLLLAMATK